MCKGLSIDGVGMSRDTVFQEIRPGAGFETGDFVKEKGVGGATVERLAGGQLQLEFKVTFGRDRSPRLGDDVVNFENISQ